MTQREKMKNRLINQMKKGKHLVGVGVGSGLTASNAVKNEADLILALSSGVFRSRGVSSLAAYLPAANSNQLILETYQQEIAPRVEGFPVVYGLMATDPMISIERFIQQLKSKGIAEINNYPTVVLIDGQFREYLEENGFGYRKEVEAISYASQIGLFTVAFVFDSEQIRQMMAAGADIICLHLGLTTGGDLGAKQIRSLQATNQAVQAIFGSFNEEELMNQPIMIYGGPITSLNDAQFIYDQNKYIDGYIGGSVFERIPTEKALEAMIQSFQTAPDNNYLSIISEQNRQPKDYAAFVQSYIHEHYSEKISFQALADLLYLSRSYLSTLFTQQMGKSFNDYLIDYRLARAVDLMKIGTFSLTEIASLVGYDNYPHFSKLFKKRYGIAPKTYVDT